MSRIRSRALTRLKKARSANPVWEPAENPLAEVGITGSLEQDSARELDALQQGFRKRRLEEERRYARATDGGYWCCLVAADGDTLREFWRTIGLPRLAGMRYVDLREVAKHLAQKNPMPSEAP